MKPRAFILPPMCAANALLYWMTKRFCPDCIMRGTLTITGWAVLFFLGLFRKQVWVERVVWENPTSGRTGWERGAGEWTWPFIEPFALPIHWTCPVSTVNMLICVAGSLWLKSWTNCRDITQWHHFSTRSIEHKNKITLRSSACCIL